MEYPELRHHAKIAWLNPEFLQYWVNGSFLKGDCVSFPVIKGAEDAVIDRVFWDEMRRCFGIVLLREDFPECCPGEQIPSIYGECVYRDVKLPLNGVTFSADFGDPSVFRKILGVIEELRCGNGVCVAEETLIEWRRVLKRYLANMEG